MMAFSGRPQQIGNGSVVNSDSEAAQGRLQALIWSR
jgi:hypothetical protein